MREKCFVEFDRETSEKYSKISKPEGELKRKRGRPRKYPKASKETSFETFRIDTNETTNEEPDESKQPMTPDATSNMDDTSYHALLAKIDSNPSSFKEAMQTREKSKWQQAVGDELMSMNVNVVWTLVDRPKLTSTKSRPNVIDSKWVLKRKYDQNGGTKYKGRLVIRGFKDCTKYNLTESYAPVPRLSLVRAVLAIIDRFELEVVQLHVKTAFLNGRINKDIYMELPEV